MDLEHIPLQLRRIGKSLLRMLCSVFGARFFFLRGFYMLRRFEGEFYEDEIQGSGRLLWADGSIHVGQFLDELPHGLALYQGAAGCTYIGQFVNGMFL